MANRVVITLTDEQKARFEAIAKARQEPFVAAVQDAVSEYLERFDGVHCGLHTQVRPARAGR